MATQIVFNLYQFTDNLYLPSAHIVDQTTNGQLGYPLQRATLATIVPHGHDASPPILRLFSLIDELIPGNLESRYKASKASTATPLAKLLEEPTTKPLVEKYIFERLDSFLTTIVSEHFPLTLDMTRDTPAESVRISTQSEDLIPHISFHKNEEGVEYRFQLGTEMEKWPIRAHKVRPLTNADPAWLLVDSALFRVPGINGNMVKPFQQKDVIHIPQDKAKVYFRQFVAKNAGRTRIEASGFELLETRELTAAKLVPTENVLEGAWYLQTIFSYGSVEFRMNENRDRVTSVDFSGDTQDEFVIRQVIRDQSLEKEKVSLLQSHGLEPSGSLFHMPGGNNLEQLVAWLARHGKNLQKEGFHVELPLVANKSIALVSAEPAISVTSGADWFDIHGNIPIGEFSIPFKALRQNLRARDPYFALPDGTFFLIPETWFTRYTELAETATDGPDNTLRIPKSLFTLLESAGIQSAENGEVHKQVDPSAVAYEVSADLKAELRPYQLEGVKWLVGHLNAGFGACLADDMGLGKTLQAIALLLYAKQKQLNNGADEHLGHSPQLDLFQSYREDLKPLNALIILPASLVFNWQKELMKFAPSLMVCVHTGPKRGKDARALSGFDVVLTTYHTARQDLDMLQCLHWKVIILDESQQIKNRQSEISKVVLSLNASCKVSLSGTPIENSLSDLWSQMEFINPATLGSFKSFKEKFIVPIEKLDDEMAKEQLFRRVRPFFLRRTKEQVAPDLPELTEQLFYSEMTTAQEKLYEKTKSAARNEILSLFGDPQTRFQALQALTRLRQIANDPRLVNAGFEGGSGKFNDVLATWDTIQRAGHKVLFFSSFEKHLELFRKHFETNKLPYAWLSGSTSMPDRAKEVNRFQEDPNVQAFFMTIKAGGVGLNLTAADYVFILDPWWNPAIEDQAIARAHRIGQIWPVTAQRFLSRNTIEEKIRVLQDKKRKLGESLFDEEPKTITMEEMEELLA
ncbi:MAG: SNF2-related protein [Saprospiraceae bacterium]